MAAVNPQRIDGHWSKGVALDFHTISSTHAGVNENGNDRYDTVRSELGELIYRLKYKQDQRAADPIITTAVAYLIPRRAKFDLIVPVPPSSQRANQPVLIVARGIGQALGMDVSSCIMPTRETTQLKDVSNPNQRAELLDGLYRVDPAHTENKRILLIDDLYRSGSTLNAITDVLLNQGRAAEVIAFTITRSRKNT